MEKILYYVVTIILIVLFIRFKKTKLKKAKYLKDELYNKTQKIIIGLYILSFILAIVVLVINIYNLDTINKKGIITSIINAISILILTLPLSIDTLYKTSYKQKKYFHIKTIVTNMIPSVKIKRLFNDAGINMVVLTDEEAPLQEVKKNRIDKKILRTNVFLPSHLEEDVLKVKDDYTLIENENLNEAYNKIKISRGIDDNYIRTWKYIILTYLPLIAAYILYISIGFPVIYNLIIFITLKLMTYIASEYIYKILPFDTDIMIRKPKGKKDMMGISEWLILFFISFIIMFIYTIPYMFILSYNGYLSDATTIMFTTFLFVNLFITISYISEENFFKNIVKLFKEKRLVLYSIVIISTTILMNFIKNNTTSNIGLQNYFVCLIISLIPTFICEIIKIARFQAYKKGR